MLVWYEDAFERERVCFEHEDDAYVRAKNFARNGHLNYFSLKLRHVKLKALRPAVPCRSPVPSRAWHLSLRDAELGMDDGVCTAPRPRPDPGCGEPPSESYRGGSGFANSECTSCQFSHMHTRACLSGALAMLLLGRAVYARPFCEKSTSAHFKMSPLSRANWQYFFRVARGRLAGKGGLRTAARRHGPKKLHPLRTRCSGMEWLLVLPTQRSSISPRFDFAPWHRLSLSRASGDAKSGRFTP